MSLVAVEKLSKIYQDGDVATHALRSVSFVIDKGEFVAIMGPSGSGKSTLLQLLGLLDTPTSGSYHLAGTDITALDEATVARTRNERMGFVFQSFNLLPRTSVFENVKLPLLYSRVSESLWDEQARHAIESVGLSHRLAHEPSQLSGGEKQRVAIARALVTKPEIIFADEPTGNLDSKSGQMVLSVLQHLNDVSGHTIILITHETTTAEHASRIIRIRDGAIESDIRVGDRRRATEAYTK